MMISRHRQWRAWQFGRRHSGLFSGSGASGGDGDDFWGWVDSWPAWVKATVVVVIVGGFLLTMVVWGPVALLKVLFWILIGMVCLLCVAWIVLQVVMAVRVVVDWIRGL